jgi:beta-lactamase regulating signal transducer with metallopeptidase domain
MIGEIFLRDVSLSSCVWQSTIFLVVGLVGSFILRYRSSRAHQVLFLAMIAAVIVPIMSILVKHYELGMFVAEPVVIQSPAEDLTGGSNYGAPGIISAENIEHNPGLIEKDLPSALAGSESAKFPWRSVMLYVWIAASLILFARLLVTFVLGVRLLGRALPLHCERIEQALHLAGAKLGIDKDVSIRNSQGVRSPVIWCWRRRPVLLVPSDAARFDNGIDWTGVLCHELAHWKRRDHISGLLAELVVCILPWHPLVWWAKSRLVRLSEQACDDWVVATSQSGTDYAETLLDLIPGGQMAFAPAVVSSKRGLAGRVHRILKNKCSNPRTGVAWALGVSIVAICLAVGIAFAQTRPSLPTGTIKTKVGRSAIIEQPASAMIIKGHVLNSDNKPAFARIIAMPNTSYGAEIRTNNKEGYFELSWSPTWLDESQPICIIARSGHYTPRGGTQKNEAAVVEITDPTQPVTIRLEPALLSLEGKVAEPNGQRIEYRATLSLVTEFKCQAPIFETTVGFPRERIFSPIPYGTKYRLTIQAEGYQTKQLIVDATDRSKEVIDIGMITLQPQDPAKPADAEQSPNLDLAKQFHDIYRLEEQEVMKLIKPPFLLGRQEYLLTTPLYSSFALQHPGHHYGFHWDNELKMHSFSTSRSLWWILYYVLGIPEYDYNLPKELKVNLPGDWIVRAGLPVAQQLKALEEIIYAELHRSIRFEKRKVEREVIVATGRFEFKPLRSEDPNWLYLYLNENDRLWGNIVSHQPASISELLLHIADGIDTAIEDKTEPCEIPKIRCRCSSSLAGDMSKAREKNLPILLDNLAKQTGLQFTVERQPAEIWFVTETKEN